MLSSNVGGPNGIRTRVYGPPRASCSEWRLRARRLNYVHHGIRILREVRFPPLAHSLDALSSWGRARHMTQVRPILSKTGLSPRTLDRDHGKPPACVRREEMAKHRQGRLAVRVTWWDSWTRTGA